MGEIFECWSRGHNHHSAGPGNKINRLLGITDQKANAEDLLKTRVLTHGSPASPRNDSLAPKVFPKGMVLHSGSKLLAMKNRNTGRVTSREGNFLWNSGSK